MLGVDSRSFKKAIGLNQQRTAKAKKINIDKQSPEDLVDLVIKGEGSTTDIAVAMTTGWENFATSDGPVKFSAAVLKDFLVANPGYKEQAVEFYADRANHLGND